MKIVRAWLPILLPQRSDHCSPSSLSPDDPVVDFALVEAINKISPSVHWKAAANLERFGNMTRQQLQATLLRTGPWSEAPAPARAAQNTIVQKKQTGSDTAKWSKSRIPESFDARQQVGLIELLHASVPPVAAFSLPRDITA